MKNVFTSYIGKAKATKKRTTKKNQKSFGSKLKAGWNNNKAAVGTTVKSTLVVGAGTFIGLAASKMLGRK